MVNLQSRREPASWQASLYGRRGISDRDERRLGSRLLLQTKQQARCDPVMARHLRQTGSWPPRVEQLGLRPRARL